MSKLTKDKINICFFSPNALPLIEGKSSGFGGGEVDLWNLAVALGKDDIFHVYFIVVDDRARKFNAGNITVIVIERYKSIRKYRGYFLRYLIRIFKTFWGMQVDVYFVKLSSLEMIIVGVVARLKRKKFIFRLGHDWETDYQSLKNNIFNHNKLLTKLFIVCLKKADLVISQTRKQKELLKKNFNINSVVIYNAHHIPQNINFDGKFSILWVGRIHPMKRPRIFLDLAKKFPGETFIMIGPPDENHLDLFKYIKNETGKIKNLEFIDGVPNDEIEKYYQKAKLFVLTSQAEGFSNVLIEALKTKTPVVSLSVDPDDILTNNKNGFCAVGDVNKMVEYIVLLLADKKLWQLCSERAYGFAKENFNIEKIIKKYKKIFYEIAKRD